MNKTNKRKLPHYVIPTVQIIGIIARKCIASSGYTEGFDTSEGSWNGGYESGNEGFGTEVPGTWGE